MEGRRDRAAEEGVSILDGCIPERKEGIKKQDRNAVSVFIFILCVLCDGNVVML